MLKRYYWVLAFLLALIVTTNAFAQSPSEVGKQTPPAKFSAKEWSLVPPPAEPQDPPLTVSKIQIDKADVDPVTARAQAIIEARRTAFGKLAERNLTPEQFKDFKTPDDKLIASFVQDFEIKKEQISSKRYVAEFTVRFGKPVLDFFKTNGGGTPVFVDPKPVGMENAPIAMPIKPEVAQVAASIGTRTILVLPYYKNIAGKNLLWEDPNPWREAWQALGSTTPKPNITIVVPLGDIADIAAGSTDAVWQTDFSVVEKLREKYNADEVIITVAGKSSVYTRVDVYTYRQGAVQRQGTLNPYTSGQDEKAVFKETVTQVIDEILALPAPIVAEAGNEATAAAPETAPSPPLAPQTAAVQNAESEKPSETMQADLQKVVPPVAVEEKPLPAEKVTLDIEMEFINFTQWLEVQKRLSSISPSLFIDIVSLNKSSARFGVTLDIVGGFNGFEKALTERGMAIEMPIPVVGDPSQPASLQDPEAIKQEVTKKPPMKDPADKNTTPRPMPYKLKLL